METASLKTERRDAKDGMNTATLENNVGRLEWKTAELDVNYLTLYEHQAWYQSKYWKLGML